MDDTDFDAMQPGLLTFDQLQTILKKVCIINVLILVSESDN